MFFSPLLPWLLPFLLLPKGQAEWDEPIEMPLFLQNEDIKNTWPRSMLEHCRVPKIPPPEMGLDCFVSQLGYERVPVEVLSRKPPILRLPRFLGVESLAGIGRRLNNSNINEVQSQGVEGFAYSPGHRGRQADGLWLLHQEKAIRPLFERMQKVLALNPAFGEDFLVLKYDPFGHYAPHFDHLQPMPAHYDEGWFVYFGNRLATALLLVETATKGGFTVFPELDLTISPERDRTILGHIWPQARTFQGDLLLWFNADSNDRREEQALHAACPILEGHKIAVSLWIRGTFQHGLKCALDSASYEPADLVRKKLGGLEGARERPAIPGWVFE